MDGRSVNRAGGATAIALRRGRGTGAVIAPLMLIPFLSQLDVCLLKKQWYIYNPFALALVVLSVLLIVGVREHASRLASVVRGCQGLIAGFAILAVMALWGATLPDANLDEGGKYIFYPVADAILFTLAIGVSVMSHRESSWRLAVTIAAFMMVASIVWDSIFPATFSELTTRAAGFGVNPNIGGAVVGILLIGALPWNRCGFDPVTLATLAITGAGVFLTLSRSSLLCWGVVTASYVIRTLSARGASGWIASVGLIVPLVLYAATAGEWMRQTFPMLQASHERIEMFLGGGEMDHADDSRVHLAEDYFISALESPWVGWGTGLNYSTSDGAHNIFLAKWVENGVGAMGILVLCMLGTYRMGVRYQSPELKTLAAFLFVQGFFSHNMLEDKTNLMMWGILAGRAVVNAQMQKEQQPSRPERAPVRRPVARPAIRIAASPGLN